MTIGELIKTKREDLGMRQTDLAHKIKIPTSYLCKLESNTNTWTRKYLYSLLDVLDISEQEFMDIHPKAQKGIFQVREYVGLRSSQHKKLKKTAKKKRVSMAEIIREAIDYYLSLPDV